MTGAKTVTLELAYEDALRLWVLVHDPGNAGEHRADGRLRKLVTDAVAVCEEDFVGPGFCAEEGRP